MEEARKKLFEKAQGDPWDVQDHAQVPLVVRHLRAGLQISSPARLLYRRKTAPAGETDCEPY